MLVEEVGFTVRSTSLIWKGFIRIFHWISRSLCLKFGNKEDIRLGIDPFVGMEKDYALSLELISFLNSQDIGYLIQLGNCGGCCFSEDYWFTIEDLELAGEWVEEWSQFTKYMYGVGTRLSMVQDDLIWSFNKAIGKFKAKDDYSFITKSLNEPTCNWWHKYLWEWQIPSKIECFVCLCLENRITTQDSLMNGGWVGEMCVLYVVVWLRW